MPTIGEVRDWALAHNAKELLCWSCLVEAQHTLRNVTLGVEHGADEETLEWESQAAAALKYGLKIARDCGYGLYFIDLLIARAHLHLLTGAPDKALDDIRVSLDDGIPGNDKKGLPELLAARHEACGYAWPVPEGLQLKAQALLLKAAQRLGTDSFAPAKRDQLPTEIQELITQAEGLLEESLELWQRLHDPEPERDDQNFKLDNMQYNYKAAETHRLITSLAGGLLTNFTIQSNKKAANMDTSQPTVFVSHSSKDKPFVRKLVDELQKHEVRVWFDEREMGVGDSIASGISKGLENAEYLLVVLSPNSTDSNWVKNELNAALMEEASSNGIVILPAVVEDCEIPVLLKDRIYADFRESFENGMNSLLRVFQQETETALTSEPANKAALTDSDCKTKLSNLKLAELRRRMTKKMARDEVGTVWYDTLETKMENDMKGRTLSECVIDLLDRAKNRDSLADVIENVCAEVPHVANP